MGERRKGILDVWGARRCQAITLPARRKSCPDGSVAGRGTLHGAAMGGQAIVAREFEKFEPGVTGSITSAQYDDFVRDTVNFLQYAGDPTQLQREGIGLWVILFLLLFSGIAYLLKKEYWKDVR